MAHQERTMLASRLEDILTFTSNERVNTCEHRIGVHSGACFRRRKSRWPSFEEAKQLCDTCRLHWLACEMDKLVQRRGW